MKTHYIQQGTIKEYGQPLKKTSMFNLNTWFKRMLGYFNVPYVDDCCEAPATLPVRVAEDEGTGENHQLQHYNPTTDTWDNFDPIAGDNISSYIASEFASTGRDIEDDNFQITFDANFTQYVDYTLTGNITLEPSNVITPFIGGTAMIKIIGDGASSVTIDPSIHEISTSAGFDNTLGMENFLVFFYNGSEYFVNIFQ